VKKWGRAPCLRRQAEAAFLLPVKSDRPLKGKKGHTRSRKGGKRGFAAARTDDFARTIFILTQGQSLGKRKIVLLSPGKKV